MNRGRKEGRAGGRKGGREGQTSKTWFLLSRGSQSYFGRSCLGYQQHKPVASENYVAQNAVRQGQ